MFSARAVETKFCNFVYVCLALSLVLLCGADKVENLDQRSRANLRPTVLKTHLGPRMLELGARTPINPPGSGYHGEVMIAADPESQDNLIVCGFRANQESGAAYEGYVYWSGDGGKTWTEVLIDRISQWVSEESCTFGPAHQAYFVVGDSDTSRGVPIHESGNARIYRSSDGGHTWKTVQVAPFMDYTSATVDGSSSPHRNTLYVLANALANGQGGWMSDDQAPFLSARRDSIDAGFSITGGSFHSGAKFPKGSAVLSDGTVLAIFEGTTEAKNATSNGKARLYSVELGVSKDGGKTFQRNVIYENPVRSVIASLAVNTISDEIYVCWTPQETESSESKIMDGEKSGLMLAASRDKGRTWSIKSVKPPEGETLDLNVGTVSLAVNQTGILGFMWYGTNFEDIYFGISVDQGDSMAKIVPLSVGLKQERGEQIALLADDRRLFVFPPVWNLSSRTEDPLRILPFGPSPRGVPFGNALVADRSGGFHPVWSEVTNGPTNLWTRTISLHDVNTAARPIFHSSLTDVSERVTWHVDNVRYDHLEDLVAFDVTVTNQAEETIAAPLIVLMPDSNGPLDLLADNADNGATGSGAQWALYAASDGLRCGHSTEPRTLTFRLIARRSEGRLDYRPRDLPLRVYGALQGTGN